MKTGRFETSVRAVLGGLVMVACFVVLIMVWSSGLASSTNGFEIRNALVPEEQIYHGGPPRDGIPAIDKPQFIGASEAIFLKADDRVLGVFHNGIARAYPLAILNYHEIVNDRYGDDAVVVTFCPLCGTGMVFHSTLKGIDRQFGVSGLLYNSDVLLYDRESESLWSQIMMQAVSGPLKGTKLQPLVSTHTDWSDWRRRYPATQVLSRNTGYERNYDITPYTGYSESEMIMFPVSNFNGKYHPKELVIGLQFGDTVKVYPFSELAKSSISSVSDVVANKPVTVIFNAEHRTGSILDANQNEIPTVISYWFAWIAFHPDSKIYTAN